MGQQLIDSKQSKVWGWLLAALLLATVFLINNRDLVSGARVQIWDACGFYTPLFSLVADHARAGRLLLWDPWVAAGTPVFADPQTGAASPIEIIMGVIGGGNAAAFRAYWLFIWLLGPLGLLLLACHLGAPPWGAFVVSLGYAFCGFYTGHAEHTTVLYSFSLIPWFIWRFEVALTSFKFIPAAQAGALWGLSALGGYPAIVILSGGMLLLWGLGRCWCSCNGETALLHKRPIRNRFKFAFLALVIVFCVGVLVLVPTYMAFFKEGLGYTERAGAVPRQVAISAMQNALNPGALATFASPYLTALKYPGRNFGLWPGSDISVADVYMGVLPLILCLLALWHRPRSGWRWWLVGIIAFSMACAVGDRLPIRGWLYDYFPPTRYFRLPAWFCGYAIFSAAVIALLATRDLELAIHKAGSRIWQKLLILSLVTSIAAICVYLYIVSHVANLGNDFHLSNLHLAGIWSGAVVVCLLFLLFPGARKWLLLLFAALAIADASLTSRLSQDFVSEARSGWAGTLLDRWDASHKTRLKVSLQRSLMAPDSLGPLNNGFRAVRIATFYSNSDMKNDFHEGFAKHPVLLNMALGADRIWFASDVVVATPSQNVYNALVNRSKELGAPVLVVHPPSQMAKISEVTSREPLDTTQLASISRLEPAQKIPARLIRYGPNHLEIKVSCPQDGWLLVTDRWTAGWRGKVNGKPKEVFGGDFIFRAVRVRAGENTIQFSYPQPLYRVLVFISWGTLIAVLVIPLWTKLNRAIERIRTWFVGEVSSPLPM